MFLGWDDSAKSQVCVIEQECTKCGMQFHTRSKASLQGEYKPMRAPQFENDTSMNDPSTSKAAKGDGAGFFGQDEPAVDPSLDQSRSSTKASAGTGTGQVESCEASFYDEGQQTASGEPFNTNDLTAAHKTLPFNTMVRVTNTANGQSVDVRINDRGPFAAGRCIDLSRAAFDTISSESAGVASVTVEVLQ
jgi:rare lipoprotein A (peptidoglycan hydrolase)